MAVLDILLILIDITVGTGSSGVVQGLKFLGVKCFFFIGVCFYYIVRDFRFFDILNFF